MFQKLEAKYVNSGSGVAAVTAARPRFSPPTGEGPLCYMEFSIDGDVPEEQRRRCRVVVKLYKDKAPLAANNFKCLCTGELRTTSTSTSSTSDLCYLGSKVHRIVPNFCIQAGDFTTGDGRGGRSIYPPNSEHGDAWGKFRDEPTGFLDHNRKGLLSMANSGANTNSSQFFFTLKPVPYLNGKHVVFGEVVEGMQALEELSETIEINPKTSRPVRSVTISACGVVGVDDNDDDEGDSESDSGSDRDETEHEHEYGDEIKGGKVVVGSSTSTAFGGAATGWFGSTVPAYMATTTAAAATDSTTPTPTTATPFSFQTNNNNNEKKQQQPTSSTGFGSGVSVVGTGASASVFGSNSKNIVGVSGKTGFGAFGGGAADAASTTNAATAAFGSTSVLSGGGGNSGVTGSAFGSTSALGVGSSSGSAFESTSAFGGGGGNSGVTGSAFGSTSALGGGSSSGSAFGSTSALGVGSSSGSAFGSTSALGGGSSVTGSAFGSTSALGGGSSSGSVFGSTSALGGGSSNISTGFAALSAAASSTNAPATFGSTTSALGGGGESNNNSGSTGFAALSAAASSSPSPFKSFSSSGPPSNTGFSSFGFNNKQ